MKTIPIKLLDDRLLIKQIEADEKIGSIFVPETAKERTLRGHVIALGPGKIDKRGNRKPIGVNIGDTICFGKHGGVPFIHNEDKYLIIRQGDIFGVCE